MDLAQRRKLAGRRKRYQDNLRETDPGAFASRRKRQHRTQREKLIAFLGGRCSCGHADHRALIVVQAAGTRLDWGALYTLMLAEPDEFRRVASLSCANCRLIARYH